MTQRHKHFAALDELRTRLQQQAGEREAAEAARRAAETRRHLAASEFSEAVRDVTPLAGSPRAEHRRRPHPPQPLSRQRDDRQVLAESVSEDIDHDLFARHLFTADMPDPDLLIRTSGELRVSNFLLWQIAYAEIWVTPTFWPDFRRRHLLEAILDYQRRERRFGGVHPGEPAAATRA